MRELGMFEFLTMWLGMDGDWWVAGHDLERVLPVWILIILGTCTVSLHLCSLVRSKISRASDAVRKGDMQARIFLIF